MIKKWLQDFSQMVPAQDAEGVEVVDMAAFAADVGGVETGRERPAIEGAVPFLDD